MLFITPQLLLDTLVGRSCILEHVLNCRTQAALIIARRCQLCPGQRCMQHRTRASGVQSLQVAAWACDLWVCTFCRPANLMIGTMQNRESMHMCRHRLKGRYLPDMGSFRDFQHYKTGRCCLPHPLCSLHAVRAVFCCSLRRLGHAGISSFIRLCPVTTWHR